MPYSNVHKDIYYSTRDAISETRHVFLSGIKAPDCWREPRQYVIAETGFGAGLNFLTTWDLWKKTRPSNGRLFFISIENAPLTRSQLRQAHAPYPELDALSRALCNHYPARHPGYHLVPLDQGRVELLLLFGPVETMLADLMPGIDAWFLDGFAPSRNPDMWSNDVLKAIGALSKPGARVATYSSARVVRDGLSVAGFECEKVSGYGAKRDSLRGIKVAPEIKSTASPWFARSTPMGSNPAIAVIGAGISGACVAAALQTAGADVTVIDQHSAAAGEASGNPAGLVQPRPGGGNFAYEDLQTSAYLYALRHYDGLSSDDPIWIGDRGVLSFGRDPAFLGRHGDWLDAGGLPDGFGCSVNQKEVAEISGLELNQVATWFPQAGTINPTAICRAMLKDTTTIFGATVSRLVNHDGQWSVLGKNNQSLTTVDGVVLANGHAAADLCESCDLPLYGKRGQISFVAPSEHSSALNVGLSYGGYMTPALTNGRERYHILGATYQQWLDFSSTAWKNLTASDDQENRDHIQHRLPELMKFFEGPVVGGRATLRTTTTDHLPVVGPVFNSASYNADYSDLRHGKPAYAYPSATYTPGLYVLSALGSRGFALAPLLAQILAAEIMGGAMPVSKSVHDLVHPARFLVRQLKRR